MHTSGQPIGNSPFQCALRNVLGSPPVSCNWWASKHMGAISRTAGGGMRVLGCERQLKLPLGRWRPSSKNIQWWKRSYRLCILKDLVSLDTFQHFPVKHRYPVTVRFQPVTKSPPWSTAVGSTTPLLLATKALWWPLESGYMPCCHVTPGWAFVDLLAIVQPRPSIFTAHAQAIWNPRVRAVSDKG